MILPAHYLETAVRVAHEQGFSLADIREHRRNRSVVRARNEMWLALRELGATYQEIASITDHDHSTVIHGVRRARALKAEAAE